MGPLEPGTKVAHTNDKRIRGTVVECINSADSVRDRIDRRLQGYRYIVEVPHQNKLGGLWSIPGSALRSVHPRPNPGKKGSDLPPLTSPISS